MRWLWCVIGLLGALYGGSVGRPLVGDEVVSSLSNALDLLEERRANMAADDYGENLDDEDDDYPDYSLQGAPFDWVIDYLQQEKQKTSGVPADTGELENLMSDEVDNGYNDVRKRTNDEELDDYLAMDDEDVEGDEDNGVADYDEEEPTLGKIYDEVDNVETAALEQALAMMKMSKGLGYDEDDDPFVGPELDRLRLAMNAEKAKVMLEDVEDDDDNDVVVVNDAADEAAQDLSDEADTMYSIYQLVEDLPLAEVETLANIVDNVADEKEEEAVEGL